MHLYTVPAVVLKILSFKNCPLQEIKELTRETQVFIGRVMFS